MHVSFAESTLKELYFLQRPLIHAHQHVHIFGVSTDMMWSMFSILGLINELFLFRWTMYFMTKKVNAIRQEKTIPIALFIFYVF